MASVPIWSIELALNGWADPAVDTDWTDVTGDMGPEPIVCEYGMSGTDPTDRIAATGELSFSLNNSDSNSAQTVGLYTTTHPDKRAGFDFGIGVRFFLGQATDGVVDGGVTKHVGRLCDIGPVAGLRGPMVTRCKSLDVMDVLAAMDIPALDAQSGQTMSTLLEMLLADISGPANVYTGIQPPLYRDFDFGVDAFKFAFDGGTGQRQKRREEIIKIVLSEQGYCYPKGDSDATGAHLRAEQRGARVGQATAFAFDENSIDTLTTTGNRDDIYGSVKVTVHPIKRVDASPVVLYRLGDATLKLAAGQTINIEGTYSDPNGGSDGGGPVGGLDMIAPESGTDFSMNEEADGTGTDLTGYLSVAATYSGSGVSYVLTNTGPVDAKQVVIQARGRGVYRTSATITRPVVGGGARVLDIDLPYGTSVNVATALAEFFTTALAALPVRVKSMRYCVATPELLGAAISLDLGDKIEITESVLGLSSTPFNIQRVRIEVLPGDKVFVTYALVPYGLDPDISVTDVAGPGIVAEGGSIEDIDGYRYHTFLPGDGDFVVTSGKGIVSGVAVAGGGAGGGLRGGGGAGGGVLPFSLEVSAAVGTYPVLVGEGADGAPGEDTVAFGVTAIGGAVGADEDNDGVDGGSGSGASGTGKVGGNGVPGQGNRGGAGGNDGTNPRGGGGAGAGTNGNDGDYFNGDGGLGRLVLGRRLGGGGGGNGDMASGNGKDGGGNGGAGGNPSTPGTDGTGGGGGAGEDARGGHGTVVVRYPIAA